MIHTVKGFSEVNQAEVDAFLESPCFYYDPMDVGNFSRESLIILSSFKFQGLSSNPVIRFIFQKTQATQKWKSTL